MTNEIKTIAYVNTANKQEATTMTKSTNTKSLKITPPTVNGITRRGRLIAKEMGMTVVRNRPEGLEYTNIHSLTYTQAPDKSKGHDSPRSEYVAVRTCESPEGKYYAEIVNVDKNHTYLCLEGADKHELIEAIEWTLDLEVTVSGGLHYFYGERPQEMSLKDWGFASGGGMTRLINYIFSKGVGIVTLKHEATDVTSSFWIQVTDTHVAVVRMGVSTHIYNAYVLPHKDFVGHRKRALVSIMRYLRGSGFAQEWAQDSNLHTK